MADVMKFIAWRTIAAVMTASLVLAGHAAGHRLQHRDQRAYDLGAYSLEHRPPLKFVPVLAPKKPPRQAPIDPIYIVAGRHHWDGDQVSYWLKVLFKESRSTLGHYDLTAVNGTYYGCGQLGGGPEAYYSYGGNPYTPLGQLIADANYIVQHGYGTPEAAWESELERNFY